MINRVLLMYNSTARVFGEDLLLPYSPANDSGNELHPRLGQIWARRDVKIRLRLMGLLVHRASVEVRYCPSDFQNARRFSP